MDNLNIPTPEFKSDNTEVWSSMGLTALMIIVTMYTSWIATTLGGAGNFHITHGIITSWAAFCGIQISILAAILSWRGFGLNSVGALLAGSSLGTAFIGGKSYGPTISIVLAVGLLVAAVHFTRRFFEHNPLTAFLSLWGITFASSIAQSLLYKALFEHAYPLQGVLILKTVLFVFGGLMMFLAFPKKNKEYVI